MSLHWHFCNPKQKFLVRWGIYYLQVKFDICDLMMTILVKWWFNSTVYYKIGLICKNEVNAGWWILEDMCGSDINWEKPYSELIDSICIPLLFVMLWTHQLLDLALKSPSRIVKAGHLLLILHKRFSRDRRKCSNSLWFWLGEWYKVITYPFFFPVTIPHAEHSGRFILLIFITEILSL